MKQQLISLLCGLCFLAAAIPAVAQQDGGQVTVSGRVIDSDGLPVIGAVVMTADNEATTTDEKGEWSLQVRNSEGTLEFSCLGYKTLSEEIAGRRVVDVTMQPDNVMLEETVVVGYGVQKKVNLTGSVSSIDFSDLADNRTIVSTSSALAGLAAGMSVMQGSGQPGQDKATIRIRGNGSFTVNSSSGIDANAPLVLVDGVEWSMDDVNPNDIASISVLKDASSAAIYGTRAANGVILITTKNGVEGKPSISYSYKGILQMPYSKMHFVSDYATYMELMNEACDNVGTTRLFSQSNIDLWREKSLDPNGLTPQGVPNYAAYPNTDWFEELFQTGYSQEHNLSVSGGSKAVKYMISMGYLDNEGVMGRFGIDSGTRKMNFRANVEADVTKWFTIGTRIFGQRQEYGLANVSSAFSALYMTTPGVYPGDINAWGTPALEGEESSNANNIFRNLYGTDGSNVTTRVNGSVYARIRPYKGISIEGTFNYSPTFTERHSYSVQNGTWDYLNNVRHSSTSLENAQVVDRTSRNYYVSTELLARYDNTFGEHTLGVLAGYSTTEYMSWGFSVNKRGATDWALNDASTYSEILSTGSTPRAGWGLRSYFGRINYSFRDRYLFEANLRADGSSKFGSNNRYGFFPSFSAGWKIHEEPFMESTKGWLSNLKLRASWGQAGNNLGIGNYAWQALYDVEEVVVDGEDSMGLFISSLSNADLKWETTATTDIGLDMGFFGNRLTAEVDYYLKKTTDILYVPPIYLTMGQVDGVPANLGAVNNQGVELTVNWRSSIGKNFNYFVGANFAFNKNKVVKFKGPLVKEWRDGTYVNNLSDATASWGQGRLAEGHPLGEHYLLQVYKGNGKGYQGGAVDINAGPVDGMIRTETDFQWVQAMLDSGYTFDGKNALSPDQLWYGDLLYADNDGDMNYGDDDDMNFNGRTSTPAYNLGINLGFSWKGLDFSMTWAGALDFWIIYNSDYYNASTMSSGYGLIDDVACDHYFFDVDNPSDPRTNLSGTYPRLTYGTSLSNRKSSEFYEYRGDYLKLKNVQLGYTLPEKITRKFFVQQLRFFVSGENLLTITGFPGLDPEIGATVGYPLMRQVTFGAQITF